MTALPPPLLEVRGLAKRYGTEGDGDAVVPVFDGVDLDVAAGEFVAVVGESGVGKSTLLNCIAGLDTVQAGRVTIRPGRGAAADDAAGAIEVTALAEADAARLRREHLGFVFQAFHVLPHLDVFHNVALPLLLLRCPDDARVRQVLQDVGLGGLERRLPQQLSGGQLQRVAIARALVHRPALLLADEPTGNLDPATAGRVIDLLAQQVRVEGAACVLMTHSHVAAARADRTLVMTAGGMRPAA
jgi:putative ABC transport system ATP-binding protein